MHISLNRKFTVNKTARFIFRYKIDILCVIMIFYVSDIHKYVQFSAAVFPIIARFKPPAILFSLKINPA